MARIKITALPEATGLLPTDLLTAVSSSVSTKITVQSLSNNLTEVSQSISASYAHTASFVTSSNVWGPFGSDSVLSSSYAVSSSYALTASYALNGGGGGGANPGGLDTQLQYRVNATTFGGVSTAVFDGTDLRITGSFTGSFTGSLFGSSSYALTASYTLSSSYALSSSFAVSSSFAITSSFAQTASYATVAQTASYATVAQTASYVNPLVQNVSITGSLVVSGANGAGVFSQGATLIDYIDGISNSGSYMVWRAPFSCSVVALHGYYVGGSNIQVNAARSGSSGYGLITGSNLVLTSANTWFSAIPGGLQNVNFNAGDSLQVIMSGSANNQIAVQVDLIRKF